MQADDYGIRVPEGTFVKVRRLKPGETQQDYIDLAYAAVIAKVPLIAYGQPGSGKTTAMEAIAKELNYFTQFVMAGEMEGNEVTGYPAEQPAYDPVRVYLTPGQWYWNVCDALADESRGFEGAIVVLDEFNQAPEDVMAVFQRILRARMVGMYALPRSTAILGTANPPEYATNASLLPPAVANRAMHVEWPVDDDKIQDALEQAAQTVDLDLVNESAPIVLAHRTPDKDLAIKACQASSLMQIRSFLRVAPAYEMLQPVERAKAGWAWASPRSWTAAGRVLGVARGMGMSELTQEMAIGANVGDDAAGVFWEFSRRLDLQNAEDLLLDPSETVPAERSDTAMLMASNLVAAVAAHKTPERFVNCLKAIDQLMSKIQSYDLVAREMQTLYRLQDTKILNYARPYMEKSPIVRNYLEIQRKVEEGQKRISSSDLGI